MMQNTLILLHVVLVKNLNSWIAGYQNNTQHAVDVPQKQCDFLFAAALKSW